MRAENIRLAMDVVRLGMDVYNWAEAKIKGTPTPPAATCSPGQLPPCSQNGPVY